MKLTLGNMDAKKMTANNSNIEKLSLKKMRKIGEREAITHQEEGIPIKMNFYWGRGCGL